MAFQTHYGGRFDQVRIIFCTVDIMAAGTDNAASIHDALNEVVALHAIFVGRSVRKMCERSFAELMRLQLPVFAQLPPRLEADRPVVILARNRIFERLAL